MFIVQHFTDAFLDVLLKITDIYFKLNHNKPYSRPAHLLTFLSLQCNLGGETLNRNSWTKANKSLFRKRKKKVNYNALCLLVFLIMLAVFYAVLFGNCIKLVISVLTP